jgi:hypothetical protein
MVEWKFLNFRPIGAKSQITKEIDAMIIIARAGQKARRDDLIRIDIFLRKRDGVRTQRDEGFHGFRPLPLKGAHR